MPKPQVYINVSQTLAIVGLTVIGVHYLNIQRDAVGIQKTQFNERIKEDFGNLVKGFARPFGYWL